ncbi:phage holin family protein [Liquorilactobacillus capillatus]|uniref:phage holin family protein n=1 Tax=Liquorilactobacillus capillatus TaxID=480931 RepID=UPI00070D7DB8|nr:phage holin family protein [Liquorilactobacillus capillatus]
MSFLQRTVINAVVFLATAGFFPQYFHVSSLWVSLIAAAVLGILNMFVKPFFVILSLPITVLTLGFFYLVINAFMLELTSVLMGDTFKFANFGAAFLVALVLSGVNLVITNYRS